MRLCTPKLEKNAEPTWTAAAFSNMPTNPYVLNREGNRVANIPYQEYLTEEVPDAEQYQLFDIREYGAAPGQSAAKNTEAIQNAIEAAGVNGGCIVVQGGVYQCGTIELLSDTGLFVAADATLQCVNYGTNETERLLGSAFITAENASNVWIGGGGTIDGNYESFFLPAKDPSFTVLSTFSIKERVIKARDRIMPPKGERPNLVKFIGCTDVEINNIKLANAAHWTCVITNCENITIANMVIDNNFFVANTDGIDIESSRHVTVENCFIVTADDGVCIKTTADGPAAHIVVKDCKIMSLANNFKIGTETQGDVTDVHVSDCFFFTSGLMGGYAGIAIESADGAKLSRIVCEDIQMTGVTSPLLIWLGNRLMGGGSVGTIDGVTIRNIKADMIDLPIAIVGCKAGKTIHAVRNVTLENITARYRDIPEKLRIFYPVPRWSQTGYPEITRVSHIYLASHELSGYWDLPYYGLFVRDYENMIAQNINVMPRSVNTRPFGNLETK